MPINDFPRADCHCHTDFSDGTLSPVALLDLAKSRALSGLSITDHDTLEAYETAIPYAQTLGIELIPGIELSSEHQQHSVHVLGYAFDRHSNDLQNLCVQIKQDREERNVQILAKLAKRGILLTWTMIQAEFPNRILGRPHIAHMMVKMGYAKTPQQAFDRYLSDSASCYVKGTLPSAEHVINVIHRAGGLAIIAHPHLVSPKRLINALVLLPFDGIEVYYGRRSPTQERPWIALAKRQHWIMTGGSDYHGSRSYEQLGSAWTPEETFALFKERYSQTTCQS